jgi:hypothetical protein
MIHISSELLPRTVEKRWIRLVAKGKRSARRVRGGSWE